MNINTKVRIVLSVILSICAVILISSYLGKDQEEVTIIVAARDIERGVILEESMLLEKSLPIEVKEMYFMDVVSEKSELVGSVTKQKIRKEEAIFKQTEMLASGEELSKAVNKDGIVNDAYFIPEDSRLVSIEVDNSGSINYSIKKGDFVDVIFSSVDESTGGLYTSMLLQHMEVYEVEEIVSDDGGVIAKRQNITILGTPQECLTLVAGNRNGLLDLALNPLSGSSANLQPVSILSYSASPPATREEILNGLRSYIMSLDLRESVKLEMLAMLDSEQSLDALEEYIASIYMDEAMKKELLEIIRWEE
jgi:Flp pilus assembly protein CpaB